MKAVRLAKHKYSLVFASVCLFLFSACEPEAFLKNRPFEIVQVQGREFLLNQETGELFEIEGRNVFQLRKFDRTDLTEFEQAKALDHDPIKEISFNVSIKYRNEKLLYRANIGPETDVEFLGEGEPEEGRSYSLDELNFVPKDKEWEQYWERSRNFVDLNFVDDDSFIVRDIRINLGDEFASRTNIFRDGERTGFLYEGEIPCTLEDFSQITDLSITYVLDKPDAP